MNRKPAPCSCGQPRRKYWHLACAQCWALVPEPLQNEVFRLFKSERGSALHIAAVRQCHEVIRENRPLTGEEEASIDRAWERFKTACDGQPPSCSKP